MKLRHSFLIFAALVATGVGADSRAKPPAKDATKEAPKQPSVPPLPEPPVKKPLPEAPLGTVPTPPPPSTPPGVPQPPDAWLGLSVVKPEPAVAAQIPSLPPGVGFVVESVLPGGPAETFQLRAMDVVWKFGDQLLVNRAQLATLLNLKRPGDEVKLAIFRAGQPLEVNLKLGAAPPERNVSARRPFTEDSFYEEKIIIPGERTATYSTDQGKAVVKREGESHRVTITDPEQKVIFDGLLPPGGELDKIPDGWHRRIWVLCRSLDHAIENQIVPVRPPRPRVVPTPEPPETPPKTASDH